MIQLCDEHHSRLAVSSALAALVSISWTWMETKCWQLTADKYKNSPHRISVKLLYVPSV